ncbi:hypothetical protein Taro_015202 [Colocasia esculenta]|uniref:CCHC-type domain-containing protein n=1 Tax=Colocasia esculenta TaxID=4460 RepID=A0A843UKQ3_COLES|nr:hypothetical protein [Colocasia esculenta]
MQETVAGLTQTLQNVVQANAAARNGAGDLHRNFRSLNPPRFSGSPDPDEAENWQEEIKRIFQVMQCTNREKVLGPHKIQTYTEMVQRAPLVEDTMAKVEGIREKDISKPTFIKRGAVDTTGTFSNNNNNNNKRPTTGKDYGMEKKIKVEETMTVEYCKFCSKPGHQADKCWKKARACLRCGSHEHRIPNCPMLKDQAGRNQGVVKRQERVNAMMQAELPERDAAFKASGIVALGADAMQGIAAVGYDVIHALTNQRRAWVFTPPRSDYVVQEEEQIEDGNASE